VLLDHAILVGRNGLDGLIQIVFHILASARPDVAIQPGCPGAVHFHVVQGLLVSVPRVALAPGRQVSVRFLLGCRVVAPHLRN